MMACQHNGTRYFDVPKSRLICFRQRATPEFWDAQWGADRSIREEILHVQETFATRTTQGYLRPEDGMILEGGCGTGVHVAALTNSGYRCIGVDNAVQTVRTLNEAIPELDIRLADVHYLDSGDASFAGYWSLGVIEHCWDGYEAIGLEMARVIRPGGYLFLTFPYMSPCRRFKAVLGQCPVWERDQPPSNFYQFALDHQRVIRDFESWGFKLRKAKPMLGLRAAKDEILLLAPLLEKLYVYRGGSVPIRGLAALLSKLFTPVCGHQVLLVFSRLPNREHESGISAQCASST
jgi:SAM-dependent methyltransferase